MKNHTECLLAIYQPKLYNYREDVFKALSDKVDLVIIDGSDSNIGLPFVPNTLSIFGFDLELYLLIYVLGSSRLTHLLHPSNLRGIAFYVLPLICRAKRIKLFFHGQGDFKLKTRNWVYKFFLTSQISSSWRYISYCSLCANEKVFKARRPPVVVLNRFESINKNMHVDNIPGPLQILFIGRPRKGSGVEFLPLISQELSRCLSERVIINVIGLDSFPNSVDYDSNLLKMYGELRDRSSIARIASSCSIGLYFGNAGLSVLHYMSLGLCPVIHGNFIEHSGPEPRYVINKHNGLLFNHNSLESCVSAIVLLQKNPSLLLQLRANAFKSAIDIHSTSYSSELYQAMFS